MMTVRRAFLLLVAPLFLLLAGVNGALLFLWERAEAARELDNQALAAAVTVAAFASGADDLAATLRDPRRSAAFREAAARVEGLDGIYIADAEDAALLRIDRKTAAVAHLAGTPVTLRIGGAKVSLRAGEQRALTRGESLVVARPDGDTPVAWEARA